MEFINYLSLGGAARSKSWVINPSRGRNGSPNVIPMADVMLVLLIIFMVVTPMLQKDFGGYGVSDYHADLPDADKDDAIIVVVTSDGHLFLGSTQGGAWSEITSMNEQGSAR